MISKEQECYIIITPNDDVYKVRGSWPSKLLRHLVSLHKKVTVVSLYSNTVKFVANGDDIDCNGNTCVETYREVHFDLDYEKL